MSIALNRGAWYSVLWTYKRAAFEENAPKIASLAHLWLRAHEDDIEHLLGGPRNLITIVPSTRGETVTFTVSVAPTTPNAPLPTGTVTLLADTLLLATVPLTASTPTFSTSTLSVGPHTITATFNGAERYLSSTSAPVQHTVVQGLTSQFTWTPLAPGILDPVVFKDTSLGNPTAWHWIFGDGSTSDERNPAHSYNSFGPKTVTLRVRNSTGSSTISHTLDVTCPTCITISGYVGVPPHILLRGDGTLQRSVTATTAGMTAITPVGADGRYVFQNVPPGSYTLRAHIAYEDERPHVVERVVTTDYLATNARVDMLFPAPIVLVHGVVSNANRWANWQRQLEDKGYLTITVSYGDAVIPAATEITYFQLDRAFTDLFLDTPPYNAIAHSMGGIIVRRLYDNYARETPIANALQAIVMLGTPNMGTDCYQNYLGIDLGLSRLDLRRDDATWFVQHVRMGTIAGTQSSTLGFSFLDRAGSVVGRQPCPSDCAPNDGIVPINSVFTISTGDGHTAHLNGISVPYNHVELGTAGNAWLLDEYILPFFAAPAAAFPDTCPGPSYTCNNDGGCAVGHGVVPGSQCAMQLVGLPFDGVALSWADGTPTATRSGSLLLACPILYRSDKDDAQGYNIYRSTTPMNSPTGASRIAWVDAQTTSYFDPGGTAGSYYLITRVTRQREEFPWPSIPVTTARRRSATH